MSRTVDKNFSSSYSRIPFLYKHNQSMDTFDTRYYRVNKVLLSLLGLWPIQSSSNKNIIFYCVIISILSVILPQIAYLFKHSGSLDDIYDVLSILPGMSQCLVKEISFHWKCKQLTMLVQHVHHDWGLLANHDDICILMKYVESSRIFTLAYIIFISTGTVFYLTTSFFDNVLTSNITRPKQLPHPSEFFFDLEKYYYVLMVITYVGYIICNIVVIATDTIYFVLLQHACGTLAILSHRLEKLTIHGKSKCINHNPISQKDKNVENVVQCVKLQIRIERLIQLIESTFGICLIIEIGLGILFQCSVCVMIATHTNTMYLMKLCPALVLQATRIFFNSWMGQRLIDHSSKIPVAAYNGLWYETSSKAKKMLLFLIMKCQKPYCITIAKLYVISLESYSRIMKTSASYVTLMISLNSDDV